MRVDKIECGPASLKFLPDFFNVRNNASNLFIVEAIDEFGNYGQQSVNFSHCQNKRNLLEQIDFCYQKIFFGISV